MRTQLPTHLPDKAREVLVALWKAFTCAQDLNIDPWEFSLPLLHLLDLGVDKSDLRWLVLHGYVTFRDRGGRFQPGTKVATGSDPRFLITELGVSVADAMGEGADLSPSRPSNSAYIVSFCSQLPNWDSDRRVLYFGGRVVKRYRFQAAANQVAILTAFQEEHWPYGIDDPLSPLPDLLPKQRLNETIKSLNANQPCPLLRFRGDGSGERVCWEPRQASVLAVHGQRRAA